MVTEIPQMVVAAKLRSEPFKQLNLVTLGILVHGQQNYKCPKIPATAGCHLQISVIGALVVSFVLYSYSVLVDVIPCEVKGRPCALPCNFVTLARCASRHEVISFESN